MKVIIKRSEWLRGQRPTFLCRPGDMKKCCLGFRAIAMGVKEKDMKGLYTPWDLIDANLIQDDPAMTDHGALTKLCQDIIRVNDSVQLDDTTREEALKNLFAQAGDEIEFVD